MNEYQQGEEYLLKKNAKAAYTHFQKASDLHKSSYGKLDLRSLEADFGVARAQLQQGLKATFIEKAERLAEALEASHSNNQDAANFMHQMGKMLAQNGPDDLQIGVKLMSLAADLKKLTLGNKHHDVSIIYSDIGRLLYLYIFKIYIIYNN